MSAKTILILAFAVAVASAAVPKPLNRLTAPRSFNAPKVPVAVQHVDSESHFIQTPGVDGSFEYAFETAEGIKVEERTIQKAAEVVHEVVGSFSYNDPKGTTYTVTYVANENGFQPKGAHLPVGPPIPLAIQRALQYIKDHTYKGTHQF